MTIKRPDLPIEVDDVLDGTGNYYSEWVDSSKILSVRVVFNGIGNTVGAAIQESNDTVNIVHAASGLTNGSEVNITGRYFRLWLANSTPGEVVRATVRAVS
jgi:hypothetical protein